MKIFNEITETFLASNQHHMLSYELYFLKLNMWAAKDIW